MQLRAVVSDMDGTLFNPHHELTDNTIRVLSLLKEKGIFFVVATGRPYVDVFPKIKASGLKPDYIITSNGARIHDGKFNLIREHNMDATLVRELVQIASSPDQDGNPTTGNKKEYATNVFRGSEWLTDKSLPDKCVPFHPDLVCQAMGDALHQIPATSLAGVHEMWFLGEHDHLVPMQKYIKKNCPGFDCYFSLPVILDCVRADVSKGRAVAEVCELLGISLDEVACFGDGMNDLSMLSIAGRPFVMGNAAVALKEALKHATVIGTNAEEGVAKTLQQLFM